jgi:putative DNA primase/helicase
LNANFKPGVEYPQVDQFIESIFIDKNDPDYNKIKIFWEFVGWIIHSGEIELKKAILLVGSGDNGKTVLLNFLKEMIGHKNTAAVGLYDLVNDKYAAGDLFGKKANLAGEMTTDILKDIEIFKKLTGGDLIRTDQKYKDPLEFTNKAKLIFALNTLPKVKEYEEAFFNRLIILRTPNIFNKENKNYDPEILNKITTEKALAYGLKKAIEGFARLIVNDFKFTESAKVEKELINYIAQANTAIPFIKENCNLKPGAVTSKKDLYLVYKTWAQENGFGQMSSRKLTTRIKQGFNELKTTRLRFDGERLQAWKGLELKQSVQNSYSFN